MAETAMPGPGGAGQLEPQAIRLLMQMLSVLRKNGPQAWPQLFQMAVRAGIPQEILPPPNAPPNIIAQFARKLVMFLRAHNVGAQRPQPGGVQGMQYGGPVLDVTATPAQPAMAMAYGGPVLDVTVGQDRPAMAMAYGGQVLDVTASPGSPAMAMARGGRLPPGDTELIAAAPGEYVASRGALQLDPSLDDRIRAANIAAHGREGPIMLAQQGPTLGTQIPFMETSPDFFGSTKKQDEVQGPRYKGGSDFKAKPPSDEQLRQHTQKALKEGRENQRRRQKGRGD